MKKQEKEMWWAVFIAVLPLIVQPLAVLLKPRPCMCGEKKDRMGALIALAVFGYAAFIALTILFVKLSWRYIL